MIGKLSNGRRYRVRRTLGRQYECLQCGSWLTGADNIEPGVCSVCRNSPDETGDKVVRIQEHIQKAEAYLESLKLGGAVTTQGIEKEVMRVENCLWWARRKLNKLNEEEL